MGAGRRRDDYPRRRESNGREAAADRHLGLRRWARRMMEGVISLMQLRENLRRAGPHGTAQGALHLVMTDPPPAARPAFVSFAMLGDLQHCRPAGR